MSAIIFTVVFHRKDCYNDAERDVLATAEFLVIINFSHTVTGRTGQYSQRTLATLCMTVRQTREGIH